MRLRIVVASLVSVMAVVVSAATQTPVPQVYTPGPGVTNPVVLSQTQPKYTRDAMLAKIAGEVWLDAVVGVDGVVTDTRVTRSLDRQFGLDDEAEKAARQWRFRPGRLADGTAVPVRVNIVLSFRLDSTPSDAAFRAGTTPDTTPGFTRPTMTSHVEPKYTRDAMQRKVQGDVLIDVVVDADGRVARTRVVQPLDPELDEQARQAASAWTFAPATVNGQPVTSVVTLTMTFRLR